LVPVLINVSNHMLSMFPLDRASLTMMGLYVFTRTGSILEGVICLNDYIYGLVSRTYACL